MADRNTKINGNQIKDATITADELATSVAGDGLGGGGGSALSVNVDDSSIETNTDALRVKALGITNAMLAGSITDAKLSSDYIQTSEVDDISIEFSGSTLNIKALGVDTAELAADAVTAAKLDETDTYDFTSGIVRVATPSGSTDATPKSYVDGLVNGLDWKNSVRIASDPDANWTSAVTAAFAAGTLTLAVLPTGSSRGLIDGVEPVDGDRILIKDAGAALSGTGQDDKYNGLWEVTGGTTTTLTLTRTTDADVDAEVTSGLATFVEEGSVNSDRGYTLTTNDPITVNTTAQVYTQFTGLGVVTAGIGLTKTGDTIDLDLNTLSTAVVDVANDEIAIVDNGDGSSKKESVADLITAVAGDGLGATNGVLAVNVDDATIETNTDTLRVKALGIDTAELAANAVTAAKIDTAVAGVGLTGGGGSALAVDLNELPTETTFAEAADFIAIVDATGSASEKMLWSVIATKIAGSGITATNGVLSADSIANQISESDFVKSVQTASGSQTVMTTFSSSAAVVANSVQVYLNGLIQEEGAGNDYTIVNSTGVVTFLVGLDAGDIVTLNGVLDN